MGKTSAERVSKMIYSQHKFSHEHAAVWFGLLTMKSSEPKLNFHTEILVCLRVIPF